MLYSVHIEQLDDDGVRIGDVTTRHFPSQEVAIRFTRTAVRLTEPLREPMMLSLHHPDGTLLLSFTTRRRASARSDPSPA